MPSLFFTPNDRTRILANAKVYYGATRDAVTAGIASLLPRNIGPNYVTLLVGPLAVLAERAVPCPNTSKIVFAATYAIGQCVADQYAKKVRTQSGTGVILSECALIAATIYATRGCSPYAPALVFMILPRAVPRSLAVPLTVGVCAVTKSIQPSSIPDYAPALVCAGATLILRRDVTAAMSYALQAVIGPHFAPLMAVEASLSQLSGRKAHPIILLLHTACAARLIPNQILAVLPALYPIAAVTEMALSERGNGFQPNVRVYIDGVYDLCHVGHKRVMERAAQHGTTLIAGVLNDEDTSKYKRAPIMTHQERCNEVLGCKFVDEIIPNAPAFGLTKEFIKEHDIHIVCYGEEYDKPDDLYYKAARDLGIAQTLPRTGGISTSDLIKRIRSRTDESLEAKDAKK